MLTRPNLRPFRANSTKIPSSSFLSRSWPIAIRGAAAALSPSPSPSPSQRQQQQQQQQHRSSSTTSHSSITKTKPKVIFSGIQPTGVPHLGNYLGALKQWVHLQNTAEPDTKLFFSVVDLHAITAVPGDESSDNQPAAAAAAAAAAVKAKVFRQRRRETLAALMAIGLDPDRSILFYQSSCSAHSELMWILSCTASMGYLSRMTQWKSKLSLSEDTEALDEGTKTRLKLGLFSYPVLQAADIMVHGATHVPVGEDQKQHLEFTRECARNFNHTYRTSILVPPETILSPARRVMSLQNPTSKMSKSDPNPRSKIVITDAPEVIHKRIMSAVTDSQSHRVTYDPAGRPGVANLLEILSILQGKTPAEIASEEGAFRSDVGEEPPLKVLKYRTADAIVRELKGVRERYLDYIEGKGAQWLDDVADKSAEKANANAQVTMERVKEAIGL